MLKVFLQFISDNLTTPQIVCTLYKPRQFSRQFIETSHINLNINLYIPRFYQALGMLFWHKHNLDKSLTDLANFTPFPGIKKLIVYSMLC